MRPNVLPWNWPDRANLLIVGRMCLGDAVRCYVCNSGEQYEGDRCDTESLDKNLIFNCDDEGLKDNKTYVMCRKFIQDGKSFLYTLYHF